MARIGWSAYLLFCALLLTSRAQAQIQGVPGGDAQLVVQSGQTLIFRAAISPSGRLALTGGLDGTTVLWSLQNGRQIRTFAPASFLVASLSISPDERLGLTGGGDAVVRAWDLASGQEAHRYIGRRGVYSPDGRVLATDGGDSGGGLIYEASSGKLLQRLQGPGSVVTTMAFSPDSRLLLTGNPDYSVRLWNVGSGREVQKFLGHTAPILSVSFMQEGRLVLTGSQDNTVRVWDARSGREARRYASEQGLYYPSAFPLGNGRLVALSNSLGPTLLVEATSGKVLRRVEGEFGAASDDGRTLLMMIPAPTNSDPSTVALVEVGSGRELMRLGQVPKVNGLSLSADGRRLLATVGYRELDVWDLPTGRKIKRIDVQTGANNAISPDGQTVLTVDLNGEAHLVEVDSGRTSVRFVGHNLMGGCVAFSDDGRFVLTGGMDAVARLWDATSGRELQRFVGHQDRIIAAAISHDSTIVLTGSDDGTGRLWDAGTGQEMFRLGEAKKSLHPAVESVALSQDGRLALTGYTDHRARLWDVRDGSLVGEFGDHDSWVRSVTFSRDGRAFLTENAKTIRLWDLPLLIEFRRFVGHTDTISSVEFLSDGRRIASAGIDGTIRFWDIEQGKELARLVNFTDGGWAVADGEGHFDASDLESVKGLAWVMSDEPMKPLPLEIFMRDYYEPRLLARVLAGEKLPEVRSLAELNLAQPEVKIVEVEREAADGNGAAGDTVRVTVDVLGASQELGPEGKGRKMQTGVYDLRLFRDGQMVAQCPGEAVGQCPAGTIEGTGGSSTEEERSQWRRQRLVARLEEGKKRIVFPGIRLPRLVDAKQVQFSAYAFNEDRVKSETDRKPYEIPDDLKPRAPRAYILSIGVNGFEDAGWNLSYAANDAWQAGSVLKGRLEALRRFEQVTWVPLISEAAAKQRVTHATKAQIEAVLKTLAGQPADVGALTGITGAQDLRRANPEDLVVIVVSTHGVVDERGRFYFLPADTGMKFAPSQTNDVAQKAGMLAHAVSNDELSQWLRGLDARNQVMIVDACHSAASVQSGQFKPGPMGSRGLGQLAFDQGMRILAATQVNQDAVEAEKTRMGLLTYALVHEGLEQGKADYAPKDGRIMLSEWLGYASEQVPRIFKDLQEGRLKGRRGSVIYVSSDQNADKAVRASSQQPSLFDFARGRDVLVSIRED